MWENKPPYFDIFYRFYTRDDKTLLKVKQQYDTS